jgi:hypothetical protein
VERHLTTSERLTEAERQEWRSFFCAIPASASEIPADKCFEWLLPQLAKEAQVAYALVNLGSSQGSHPSDRPPSQTDEIVLYPEGLTAAKAQKQAQDRARQFQSSQEARQQRTRARKVRQSMLNDLERSAQTRSHH